ncbi:RES family NAD+ phosphorylase [Methylococcus sp. Mc7]|uniref:RES family NAD+ phosphorylase n=1 Tax=Methylococcus sp. Mc7 TaxID=2860258 RepID=UPI001C5339CF|nr:RES family NAD+ phosphorylase [Methylococcus sp. Mc7]QXP82704.1 RES family NAD+ phosphorylase [Methylococcus sp. Mc7]
MPANTWTPIALASESFHWQGTGWRAVEAQHRVATMHLAAGRLDDQSLLEDILDEAKLRLPAAAEGLHWLLATPFRYWPLPGGSRFRRRTDPGVFYGAEERKTACAECGYWRLRFWLDSAGLSGRSATVELTLFEFAAAADKAIDLSRPPLSSDRDAWTHPSEYAGTQALAEKAREAGIETIRYESVRDPGGFCLALLTPEVFKSAPEPFRNNQQTWNLLIQPPGRIVWQRQLERESWVFEF